jgi:hypothetical protein
MKLCGWQRLGILFGIAFSLNLIIVQASYSASVVVINGLPAVKIMSDIDGTEKVQLTADKALEYRLLITKKDGKYYWVSRNNAELELVQSGAFYYLIARNGAGYVKVSFFEGKPYYMEHMSLVFQTITYWGVAEEFNID